MKKRKKQIDSIFFVVIIGILATILIFQYLEARQVRECVTNNMSKVITPNISLLSTEGFTQVSITVDSIYLNYAKVTLHAGCYEIDAQTDPYVARAIEYGLRHKVYFRPTIYDVIKDVFNNFGIKVIMLKINKVTNNTFIGSLYIQKGNKILALDIKPSDGTAIALRVGAPIYINNTLIKRYGRYIC